MPFFRECPRCGSHLAPGERCDCGSDPAAEPERKIVTCNGQDGQQADSQEKMPCHAEA